MIKYLRLPVQFNAKAILHEINRLPAIAWKMHYNKQHYSGNWSVIALRSPGGHADHIFSLHAMAHGAQAPAYGDTPWLTQCPTLANTLRYFECETTMVRLMKLDAGAVIKEHTDHDMCFEAGEARFHIPLQTNEQVDFFIEEERIPMRENECWYLNLNLPHRVSNGGNSDRIHLVIDCMVNDWMKALFETAAPDKKETAPSPPNTYSPETQQQIIAALRLQNNVVAHEMANKMEMELVLNKCIHFLNNIGIATRFGKIEEQSFLPGLKIEQGGIVIDMDTLQYPGDILHEAGHIAVVPTAYRTTLDQQSISNSPHRDAEEMMAIAWSYAACLHLALDPHIVFHEGGYQGGGSNIVENFQAGHFFGTPMLQWCGMTIEPSHGKPGEPVFPQMLCWMRN